MTVVVSAAKEGEPKHPSAKVTNAYLRRGARVLATQGTTSSSRTTRRTGPATARSPRPLQARSRGGLTVMKLDVYVWQARRSAVMLTALPPALAMFAWYPRFDWALLAPPLTFFGVFALVSPGRP